MSDENRLSTPSRPTSTRIRSRSPSQRRTTTATTDPSTPRPRLPSASLVPAVQTSPHYATSLRSRHSLYGTEDRVILDLGSSMIRIGYSGEPSPRNSLRISRLRTGGLWGLEKREVDEEEWLIREEVLKRALRDLWFNTLVIDPNTRKVIILESPLLSTRIKELVTRILFENLQVPSISFTNSAVAALLASGTVTGLVIDVGHLETVVLPVYHSRSLLTHISSTPIAGSAFTTRLRSLLLKYASCIPPPSSLNSTSPPILGKVTEEILSFDLVEEIKERCCFVSPSSSATTSTNEDFLDEQGRIEQLFELYGKEKTTSNLSIRIPTSDGSPIGSPGKGWLLIPGWVRERASEIFWESRGDQDELSVVEVVATCLLRVPIDMRKTMIENLLVIGGTSQTPGFFNRFRTELIRLLTIPPIPQSPPSISTENTKRKRTEQSERKHTLLSRRLSEIRSRPTFHSLSPLAKNLAILNDPSTESFLPEYPLREGNGSTPPWETGIVSWVGGSLLGCMKGGGEELLRETWDEEGGCEELDKRGEGGAEGGEGGEVEGGARSGRAEEGRSTRGGKLGRIPDWTKLPVRLI